MCVGTRKKIHSNEAKIDRVVERHLLPLLKTG